MPTLSGIVDNTSTLYVNPGDGVGIGDSNNPSGATLEGGGAIDLQGGSGIGPNVGGAVLTNVDNTIEATGGDTNGYNQNGLSVDVINDQAGVIEAAGANNGQGILVVHNDITNDGTLAATGGGVLRIGTLTIDNTGGGVLDANGSNSQITLDGTTIEGGTLQTENGGEIYSSTGTLDGSSSTVTNTGAIVGGSLTLVGAIDNEGSITIQDSSGGIGIGDTSDADVTLSGGGQIILQGGDGIGGGATNALLTNVDNTIDGAGGDSNGYDQNGLSVDVFNEQSGVIEAAGDNAGHGILVVHNDITNDGTMAASGGGTLRLAAVDIDNTGGGVMSASGANSQITLNGTLITGGTIETSNGGEVVVSSGVLDGTYGGTYGAVTNEGSIVAGSLTLAGAIVNQGSITFQDSNGSLTIGDTGATLSGGGNIFIQGGDGVGGGGLLTNVDNTIAATGGDINGYDQNGLSINVLNEQGGTIEAAGDNAGHGILIAHNGITNDGTLASTGGGNLMLDASVLNDGIVLANGGTVNVNTSLAGSGVIEVEGGGRVNLNDGTSENADFAGSGGVLALANAYSYSGTISGLASGGILDLENIGFPTPEPYGPPPNLGYPFGTYWANDQYYSLTYVANAAGTGGTLELNESAEYGILDANEDNNYYGSGWVYYQDMWSVQLAGNFGSASAFTLGSDGNGGLDISGGLAVTLATSSWNAGSGSWQRAANWSPSGVPAIDSNIVIGGAGTYTVTDALSTTVYSLNLSDSSAILSITGGDFTVNDGTGSGDLAGTIRVGAGATLTLSGLFDATATGKITTVASTVIAAIAVAPPSGATVDLVGAYLDGGSVIIANGALVEATQVSSTLAGVTVTDKGTLAAAAGGTLALVNTTVNATGGVIQADDGTHALVLLDGATINGATFVSDASDTIEVIGATATTLSRVTIGAGTVTLVDGSTATLSGVNYDYGTLALNASGDTTKLVLAGTVTLQGSGTLALTDSGNNAIYSNGASAHLINDIMIQGSGTIGDGATVLTNGGTIDATGTAAALVLNYAGGFQNQGTAEATGSAGLAINGNVVNSGTLAADGGNLSVAGAVSGTGSATIADGSTLSFAKTVASTQTVTFEDATGTLALGVAQNFAGTVSGLAAGDAIDLENFVYGAKRVSISSVTQAGNDTMVTVKDGGLTATIALLNQYAGEYSTSAGAYTLSSDQRGTTPGTLLELAAPVV